MRTATSRLVTAAVGLAAATALSACGGGGGLAAFSGTLPTAKGAYGQSATISFPNTLPPTSLKVKVLTQGHGATVQKGQLLVADYVGQVWRGKVFDSSYSRKAPTSFAIGVGQVIKGWDVGLVGQRIGSRVLLVVPPSDGYGSKGQPQAGITGKDTIAFVVDVEASFGGTAEGPGDGAALRTTAHNVSVNWAANGAPTVKLVKPYPKPTKASLVVLSRGRGAKVTKGLIILQFVAVNTSSGALQQSTWQSGVPDGENIGGSAPTSVLNKLVGLPTGSRVLLFLPTSNGAGPYVIATEIVASFPLR